MLHSQVACFAALSLITASSRLGEPNECARLRALWSWWTHAFDADISGVRLQAGDEPVVAQALAVLLCGLLGARDDAGQPVDVCLLHRHAVIESTTDIYFLNQHNSISRG